MDLSVDWKKIMHEMLDAFDRQETISLGKIKKAFKSNGSSINDEFKQYFLRVSNDRIKNTYDEFEINSKLEDSNASATDEYPNSFQARSHGMNNVQKTTNDPVEIIDISDEDDSTYELNKYIKYDEEDSHSEISDMNSNDFVCEEEFSKSEDEDCIDNEMDNPIKVEKIELDVGIPVVDDTDVHHAINTTSKDTYTLSNESNTVDCATANNTIGSSNDRRQAEPGLAPEPLRRENPTSSNSAKRYKCGYCEYSNKYKSHLDRHVRTHTGEKPYQCNICHKEFVQLHNMKKHKTTHSSEYRFHCCGCFIGFSKKSEKDAHEKVCRSRRYECHICKKLLTLSKNQLIRHMRQHNGEKPFICKICMRSFTLKNNLRRHLNTVHARKNPLPYSRRALSS
ncbi:zinc finger protein 569-like [Contarinia nasturtii]|uniref:zinc finger protein 569-like n=1 Tax=Contarinia nasturtii TaxID=265458 RepID=UPI0012D38BEC|nr:zinc finger protein 569-like [Contarinia nasturtii]